MWPAEIWHRFPSLGWLPELQRARSLSSMRPKRRLLTSESIVGNWPFLVKHPRSQPPHHHTCAPTPESGTVLVSHPRESGTVLVSHRCESGTVLASGGMHWSAPLPRFRPSARTSRARPVRRSRPHRNAWEGDGPRARGAWPKANSAGCEERRRCGRAALSERPKGASSPPCRACATSAHPANERRATRPAPEVRPRFTHVRNEDRLRFTC